MTTVPNSGRVTRFDDATWPGGGAFILVVVFLPLIPHLFRVEGGGEIVLLCHWPSVCHRIYLFVLCQNLMIKAWNFTEICICMIIVG